jgi:superfamily II DNA or RNA helicase
MNRWPHQIQGVRDVLRAVDAGQRRICLTSPTGGGKSLMMCDLVVHFARHGWAVPLFLNRRMLVDQLAKVLTREGIPFGIRAAGHPTDPDAIVQICSLQTEAKRTVGAGAYWRPHGEGMRSLAIVDEAHLQKGQTVRDLLDFYECHGGVRLGITATPLDLADLYDTLIVAGTNSDLRDCGALVLCYHYGPDEPNLARVGKLRLGVDPSERAQVKAIMVQGVFARVLQWYERLNPDGRPTLLFGPGKAEALWFAEQFQARGISAAHVDGEHCWLNGTFYRTCPEIREEIAARSLAGDVKVVTNRFVLREGVDWPWISHMILACVPGSLQTYLQIGGRGLRAHPQTGKTRLTFQDHGGAWWRFGSLNADRQWDMSLTAEAAATARQESFHHPGPDGETPPQPFRCPQCAAILTNVRCRCGFELKPGRRSRPVVEVDGRLSEMSQDPYPPRRVSQARDAAARWEQMYWRARNKSWDATFAQAQAMFALENNGDYPPPGLPLMPRRPEDWARKVADVSDHELIPKG